MPKKSNYFEIFTNYSLDPPACLVNNIVSYLILTIALSFRDLKRIIGFLLYFNNYPQWPHLHCILVKRGTVVMTFFPWCSCLGFVPHSAYQILNKRYLKLSFGRRLHFQDEGRNNNNQNKNNNNNNNNDNFKMCLVQSVKSQ